MFILWQHTWKEALLLWILLFIFFQYSSDEILFFLRQQNNDRNKTKKLNSFLHRDNSLFPQQISGLFL